MRRTLAVDTPVTDQRRLRALASGRVLRRTFAVVWSLARTLAGVRRQLNAQVALTATLQRQIEELRHVEQALRASDERYQLVAKATQDVLYDWDITTDRLVWNENARHVFGYEPAEMGDTIAGWVEKIHPEDLPAIDAYLAEVLERQPTFLNEYRFRRKDGTYARVLDRGWVVRDPEGQAIRMVGAVMDYTERKQAEDQLSFQKVLLECQTESSLDAILVTTDDGKVLSYNQRYLDMWDVSQEIVDNPSQSTRLQTVAEHVADFEAFLNRSQRIYDDRDAEGRDELVMRDGRILDRYTVPVRGPDGQHYGRVWYFRDVTEQKQAEAALRESEERFRALTEAAFEGISIQEESRILEANQAFAAMFGYQVAELIGKSALDVVAPECWEFATQMRLAGATTPYETMGLHRDGTRLPIEIHARPSHYQGRPVRVIAMRNIAERKRAEQELKAARDTALQASEAKTEFLAKMSHEIRTPMNAIVGAGELLAETPLTSEQRGYIGIAQRAGKTLLRLIDDILDLSKVEAGQMDLEQIEVDLLEVVEGSAEVVALPAHQKGLELVTLIAGDVPTRLRGDPSRLRQILINLLGNAVKFTDAGTVELLVERDPVDDRPGALRFAVRDTGIGIPKEKAGAIFERFVQVDSSTTRRYGGTGLGLAIAKHFVELMGGRIWVESELGQGATFALTVRLEPGSLAGHEVAPGTDDSGTVLNVERSGLRVLLVDDSPDNRLLIERYLTRSGHQVDLAEDGEIAVRTFQTGSYDLVIMDIQMPTLDGYAATAAMRQWERAQGRSPTPILALTANALPADVQRCLDAGCDAYVAKPVRKATLLTVVATLTGRASS